MNVAFINENTLGHASYLLPFVRQFEQNPSLGIVPYVIDATPPPSLLATHGVFLTRGFRKWGLDFHNARSRLSASNFANVELQKLMRQTDIDAVVVNTQSAGLALTNMRDEVRVAVCLDATFEQLSQTSWFAPNAGSRLFLPLTAAPIRNRERELFRRAHLLLPWSKTVEQSLVDDYDCDPAKVHILPPSVELRNPQTTPKSINRPQILFVGGDFARKGGSVLLECYGRWFADKCDLHIVTQSQLDDAQGAFVHRNVKPYSDSWCERWREASVFVFPSTLETFGIVLLEALAFQVPIISSKAGAARWILDQGRAGYLLKDQQPETLRGALQQVLYDDPQAAELRRLEGRRRVLDRFELSQNAHRLSSWLHESPLRQGVQTLSSER